MAQGGACCFAFAGIFGGLTAMAQGTSVFYFSLTLTLGLIAAGIFSFYAMYKEGKSADIAHVH